jgi:hypothetical protein
MTESQFLLLPDGRVLAHNLTPALAAVLAELNPGDAQIRSRTGRAELILATAGQISASCPFVPTAPATPHGPPPTGH